METYSSGKIAGFRIFWLIISHFLTVLIQKYLSIHHFSTRIDPPNLFPFIGPIICVFPVQLYLRCTVSYFTRSVIVRALCPDLVLRAVGPILQALPESR